MSVARKNDDIRGLETDINLLPRAQNSILGEQPTHLRPGRQAQRIEPAGAAKTSPHDAHWRAEV